MWKKFKFRRLEYVANITGKPTRNGFWYVKPWYEFVGNTYLKCETLAAFLETDEVDFPDKELNQFKAYILLEI